MQRKWSTFLTHAAIVAGSAAASYGGEVVATGAAGGWTPLLTVALAVVGSAVHIYLQPSQPAA